MDPEAPIGAKRRGFRHWRRAILLLLALPVLIFLLGNLVLSSTWSCRWLAAKIERQTGLEASVGGASWTPWNGPSVRGIELLQPAPLRAVMKEPLLRIETMRVAPVWRAWLRGRFEVRSVELDSPRFVVPLELVSHLAGASPPVQPAPAAGPAVAVATPPPAAVQPVAPPPVAVPVVVPDAPKPPPLPTPPSRPTGWLHLKNASFSVVHAGSRRTLFEISKINGAVPMSGDSAQSTLKIASISAFGNQVAAGLTSTLDWNYPMLSLKPFNLEILGYQVVLAAKIATFSTLPLQIEAQLPRQPLKPIDLPFEGQATAEAIAANARFRGLLLAPGSWQGDLITEAVSPSLRAVGQETKFDKGGAVTVLRGGMISCVDARLIGDGLSLLGNATLLADGRCAAVARLVAPPETAEAIASRLFPAIPGGRPLTPLSTPQRSAFDLEAFGNISQVFLRLGKDGPIVNFNP